MEMELPVFGLIKAPGIGLPGEVCLFLPFSDPVPHVFADTLEPGRV